MKKIFTIMVLSCLSSTASAATVGFGIDLRGNDPDRPAIRIFNISDSARLTSFTMTIGDTAFNFDRLNIAANVPGGSATLTSGDTRQRRARADSFSYSFTGFDAGEVFRFRAEIDPDSRNDTTDYRTVLFNNGSAPNSIVTATFATMTGTTTVSRRLGDRDATNTRFRYNARVVIPDVPLPAGGGLFLAGLAGLALIKRQRM